MFQVWYHKRIRIANRQQTLKTATPPDSFERRSCAFSLSKVDVLFSMAVLSCSQNYMSTILSPWTPNQGKNYSVRESISFFFWWKVIILSFNQYLQQSGTKTYTHNEQTHNESLQKPRYLSICSLHVKITRKKNIVLFYWIFLWLLAYLLLL